MSQEIKKCPHCGAEIEEQARFCLYCMTSLDEKEALAPRTFQRRQWIWILAAFLALLLIGGGLWWGLSRPEKEQEPSKPQSGQESAPETPADTPAQEEPQTGNSAGGNVPASTPGNTSGPTTGNTNGNTGNTTGNTTNTTGNTTNTTGNTTNTTGNTNENTSTNTDTEQTTPEQTTPEQTTPEQTTPEQTTPEQTEPEQPTVTAAVYKYRDAQYGVDDYLVTANVDDCVVITGIATPASDGIYQIPATIDGKTVIAIQKNAFYTDGYALTVKAVYIPAKLRTIWDNAFVGCYNLTDIYLYGKAVYIGDAFPAAEKRNGTLTIHCAYDCSNRDLRYYRNIAESYYDARYEEWNG